MGASEKLKEMVVELNTFIGDDIETVFNEKKKGLLILLNNIIRESATLYTGITINPLRNYQKLIDDNISFEELDSIIEDVRNRVNNLKMSLPPPKIL